MVDVILERGCETFHVQVASESHPVPLELALKVHFAHPNFFFRNESLFETFITHVVSPGWSTSLGVPSESSENKRNGSGNLNMNTSQELLICNDVSFQFLIMSLCFLFRLICEVKTMWKST